MPNPAPKSHPLNEPAPAEPVRAADENVVQDLPARIESDLEARMRDMLNAEGIERAGERRPVVQATPVGPAHGLAAARHELEQRSREAAKMVRMVDRHRQQLDSAEGEFDASLERFGRVVPSVKDAVSALRTAMRSSQQSEAVDDLSEVFGRNGAVLDELEAVAGDLNAHLLWVRSAWEQYAKTIMASQRLRAEAGH